MARSHSVNGEILDFIFTTHVCLGLGVESYFTKLYPPKLTSFPDSSLIFMAGKSGHSVAACFIRLGTEIGASLPMPDLKRHVTGAFLRLRREGCGPSDEKITRYTQQHLLSAVVGCIHFYLNQWFPNKS